MVSLGPIYETKPANDDNLFFKPICEENDYLSTFSDLTSNNQCGIRALGLTESLEILIMLLNFLSDYFINIYNSGF